MRIEDRFVVAAPRERVWVAIKDPAIVAPCIPGCQGVEVVSPVLYKAKIRLQVGPIKAEFNVDVEIVSETPLEEVRSRTRGEEGSRASSLTASDRVERAGDRGLLFLGGGRSGTPGQVRVRHHEEKGRKSRP